MSIFNKKIECWECKWRIKSCLEQNATVHDDVISEYIKLLALAEKNLSPCHNTAIACHWNEGRQGRGVNVQHRTPPVSGTNINIHNNYGEDTAQHVKQPPQTAFQLFELVQNSHHEDLNDDVHILRFIIHHVHFSKCHQVQWYLLMDRRA